MSGDSGRRSVPPPPPSGPVLSTGPAWQQPGVPTGLVPEPALPPKGKGKVVAVLLGVIVLIVLAIVALAGGDDDDSRGRAFPKAIRSDPSDDVANVELDDALLQPEAVLGDTLLVSDVSSDGSLTEVRAIDVGTGDERWSRDAQAVTQVGSDIFIVDEGVLTRVDDSGTDSDEELAVDDDSFIGTSPQWVIVYERDAASLVDPDTLDVLVRDVTPTSCSDNGSYCTRLDYDDADDESIVELIEVASGDSIGEPMIADGFATSFAFDDGRVVLHDRDELVLYSRDGEELSREEIAAGSRLALAVGDRVVVRDDDGQSQLWEVGNELEAHRDEGPEGGVFETSNPDQVLIAREDSSDGDTVRVCRLDDGFDCGDEVDGSVVGVFEDAFYVFDDGDLVAHDFDDTSRELWSVDIGVDRTLQVFDGTFTITETDRGVTVVEIYG